MGFFRFNVWLVVVCFFFFYEGECGDANGSACVGQET